MHAIASLLLASTVGLSACSAGDGDTTAATSAPTGTGDSEQAGDVSGTTGDPVPGAATTVEPAESSTETPASTTPPISVVEVAEVGTPGLDSDDAFCAAWSRFAGSFQVVSVTAAFGTGPPEDLAALEIAASPTVVGAYAELFDHWPDELAEEEELVADRFLGPFARRLDEARAALDATGAAESTVAVIEAAWLDGLARRDPSTPEFVVDLPDEVWDEIEEAADEFMRRRVGFGADPSLVTEADVPLTREYLAVSCPDQGTLSGQEVDSP